MASQSPENALPVFYGGLEPLSSNLHGGFKVRQRDKAPQLAKVHALPITVDEFVPAQRFYPIVFSAGENAVPLALMGLNDEVNVFFDAEGAQLAPCYIPAYVRRYPFMLARLRPDAEELSLCFDPTGGLVGDYEDGAPLFDDGKPTDATNAILKFCEDFELSAQRTGAFVKELQEADLLIEGEVAIQLDGVEQPFLYRGFQMVSEEKLRELRGDALRKMNQNGMMALIMAHLFSMQLVRDLFGKQLEQKKGPAIPPSATAAPDAPVDAPAGNA